jgi:D-3-phosphoglycerate dehydrogenase
MARVFISDKLDAGGLSLLQHSGLEVDNRPGLKDAELRDAIRQADALIVRSGTKVTAELLREPGKLRAVIRAGVGVDNIDVAAATRHGIVVMNTPGGNTVSTAEHTIAMMMALSRHIPAADAGMRQGKWERNKLVGTQLAGKTLGILGLGRIGREVARRAIGLDMKVIGRDPFLTPDKAAQLGIELVDQLETMLPRCDYLTVHTPLTDETRDLIGAAELAMLKRGARVLNCARGGIIDEQALLEALTLGHLAGAALDVFIQEPPGDNPLLKLPNLVTTPHLGASTMEAQESVSIEAAQLAINFLTRGEIQFAVNTVAVDRTELAELRLYVDMARRLGLLHSQMSRGSIQRAEVSFRGDAARRSTRLITAAFTAGLLESRLTEGVNIVNAELFARERGLDVSEQINTSKGDFSTLIRADVFTDKKQYTAAATLFGNQFLRLVQLGPYHLDAIMDGVMLIFTHRDMPGLIGHIGTIFGKHKVNIAQMTVGRQQAGGEAIAVLNLDTLPPDEALKEVQNHSQISSLSVVKLPPAGEMPVWFG